MVHQTLCRNGGGALDQLAAFEAGSGADEGDEVGCVHGPPPSLGGLDELANMDSCPKDAPSSLSCTPILL